MKTIIKILSLSFLLLSSLKAYGSPVQEKVHKDLSDIAKTYEAERKNPAAFFEKHLKDKKFSAQLQKIVAQRKIKELVPTKFEKNKLTMTWKKKTVVLEILNAATGKIKLNGFELEINHSLSAKDQVAYVSRVLRKAGYSSLWQFLFKEAIASETEELFEVSATGWFSYLGYYDVPGKILNKRNELTNRQRRNVKMNLQCEPVNVLYFETPYNSGYFVHEIRLDPVSNGNAYNEYSAMADRARALGLLPDQKLVVRTKTKNTFTNEEYAQTRSASIDGGDLTINNNSTTVVETLASYSRLDDKDYVEMSHFLHACCQETGCAEKVNATKAATEYKPSEGRK